jgi:hypothetical protein
MTIVNAQPQSKPIEPSKISSNEKNSVSISSSIRVQVTNETLKAKDGVLRSAVGDLVSSGNNILKTPEGKDPITNSKIDNLISNDTQNVQGTDATNAILGIEISKAIKTANATSDKPNRTAVVPVDTLSNCKRSAINRISCENTVTIK